MKILFENYIIYQISNVSMQPLFRWQENKCSVAGNVFMNHTKAHTYLSTNHINIIYF
jgi:hypothetical protein